MFKSIIHVGKTVFDLPLGEGALAEAARGAQSYYAGIDVTGVTLVTPKCFAQLFEGRPQTVDDLYRKVESDWPGADMRIVEERRVSSRQFREWNLAYFGASSYVHDHIHPLVVDPPSRTDRWREKQLRRLMEEFAAQSRGDGSRG